MVVLGIAAIIWTFGIIIRIVENKKEKDENTRTNN